MQKQFVTYEIALKFKELDFDEPCLAWYNPNGVFIWNICCVNEDDDYTCSTKDMFKTDIHPDGYLAPLWQQAIKFLHTKLDFYYPFIKFAMYDDNSGEWFRTPDNVDEEIDFEFRNLEEAVLTAIELCQNRK